LGVNRVRVIIRSAHQLPWLWSTWHLFDIVEEWERL
jgi:hypothetical protein